MLVVHPASTCDVCLEGYSVDSVNIPHSITCGHVFCLNCLHSLRKQCCPLCRSSFTVEDIRRLHVDRNDQDLKTAVGACHRQTPDSHPSEIDNNSSLVLINSTSSAKSLEKRITELVLASSFTTGVKESGVRELLEEVRAFLEKEPSEMHPALRSPFLLLYRFTELQAKYRHLENTNFDLRSENNYERQVALDWERKYQDLQRSHIRDQEAAAKIETSLNERLLEENQEWQKKYDLVMEECCMLRNELDNYRFTAKSDKAHSPIFSPVAQYQFWTPDEKQKGTDSETEGANVTLINKDHDVPSSPYCNGEKSGNRNSSIFHISPVPTPMSLDEAKCELDEEENHNKTSQDLLNSSQDSRQEKHNTNLIDVNHKWSTSNSISRASDSASATPLFHPRAHADVEYRRRSESNPQRSLSRGSMKLNKEKEPEISSSAPSSYGISTRTAFASGPTGCTDGMSTTAESSSHSFSQPTQEVLLLYSLLEKPHPGADSQTTKSGYSVSSTTSSTARPSFTRSNSLHQPSMSNMSTGNFQSAALKAQPSIPDNATLGPSSSSSFFRAGSFASGQVVNQSQTSKSALWNSAPRTPPRPSYPTQSVNYASYKSPSLDSRFAKAGTATLPRRGSLSSASVAAAAQVGSRDAPSFMPTYTRRGTISGASAVSPPVLVPLSSLTLTRPNHGSRWESQDSD